MKISALICFMTTGITLLSAAEEKPIIRYSVIGDSYSIGEGATPRESWPALLAKHLTTQGIRVDLVSNPSVTGWTTQQAIERELPVFTRSKPNFATLQIGVNDWVQNVDEETFRQRLVQLIDNMLLVVRRRDRLLVVNIPDFSVTPSGARYGRGRNISEGLMRFNQIIKEETTKRSLRLVNIFAASKAMGSDPSRVASDGLHPSAREYAEWEKLIFPVALEMLKN